MKKKYVKHVALLIKEGRLKKHYSQQDLSILLGYLNGQFISNIERHLCTLPTKKIPLLSKLLAIDLDTVRTAFVKDYTEEITNETSSEVASA